MRLDNDRAARQLVERAFGGGGPRSITLEVCEAVTLRYTYWSEGSRHSYVAVRLADMECVPLPHWNPPQFGGPTEPVGGTLPEGMALVEFYEGRCPGYTIYLRPENAAPLLPQAAGLDSDERVVLSYTAALKNTYGGETDLRYKSARRQGKVLNRQVWDAAVQRLIGRKLLRANGSITVEGRNALEAAGRIQVY